MHSRDNLSASINLTTCDPIRFRGRVENRANGTTLRGLKGGEPANGALDADRLGR